MGTIYPFLISHFAIYGVSYFVLSKLSTLDRQVNSPKVSVTLFKPVIGMITSEGPHDWDVNTLATTGAGRRADSDQAECSVVPRAPVPEHRNLLLKRCNKCMFTDRYQIEARVVCYRPRDRRKPGGNRDSLCSKSPIPKGNPCGIHDCNSTSQLDYLVRTRLDKWCTVRQEVDHQYQNRQIDRCRWSLL